MTRLRISLGAATREDSALIRRLENVPAPRQAEYIRRLLSVGMVAVYGAGLDGIPEESLPDEVSAASATDFRTRIRLDGIDRIERRLLSNLGLVTDAKKHLFVRRLLLAGVRCLYDDPLAIQAPAHRSDDLYRAKNVHEQRQESAGSHSGGSAEAGEGPREEEEERRALTQRPALSSASPQPQSGLIGLMG